MLEQVKSTNIKTKSYFKFIFSLLLFGFNGILSSYITLSSYEIVFLRSLIGSVFLILVLMLSKTKLTALKNKKHFLYLALSGLSMGASWLMLYEAYARVGVSIATLEYYCGPVIVILLSPFFFRERLTIPKCAGLLAVLTGMFLVNGGVLQQQDVANAGFGYGIIGAILFALMMIFNKKASGINGVENAAFQLIFSLLIVAVFLILRQGLYIPSLFKNIVPVLILGVVNTGFGCYLYFSSLQHIPAGSAAICGYLEPVGALFYSAILLNEQLAALQILGAVLIIGGAAFGELFVYRGRVK